MIAGMLAGPAMAQDLPPLAEALADIDGREVSATGTLYKPSFPQGQWMLAVDAVPYPATMAVDRDTLAAFDGCTLEAQCPVTVAAEMDVTRGTIGFVIFEIERVR